jgi:hypothetical protein
MKHLTRLVALSATTVLLMSSFSNPASAAAMNGPFGHHKGHYCRLARWICWDNVAIGDATPEQVAAGYGNIDGNATGDGRVHFVFHRDLEAAPDSVGVVPVDSTIVLSPQVSQALGYDSVTLVPGVYPVDFSIYQNGETYIDAVLAGPTPVRKGTWGLIKSLYR